MLAKAFAAAVLGAAAVNAHMKMVHPVPYGKDSLNNSPLDSLGGDFPCKLRSDTFTVSTENMMEIGVPQTLQLMGSATHGGGSCQISLTEDRAPAKESTWKVIQSYQGGCPANVTGNMGSDASMMDPTTFSFKIPDDIAAGKYTLAWTWFNRIGNREMYMNCAPITVTGGSAKRDIPKRTANYPPMFVANINGCTTKEGVDIRFPQPGPNVLTLKDDANLQPDGEAACSGTPTFGGAGNTGSGSSGSSGSGSSSSGSGSSGSDSGSPSSASAGTGPSETSTQAAAPVPTSTSAPTETAAPSVPQPATTTVAPASPSSSSSGSSGALTGPCSPEGAWNCIAGASFQRCANGQWTPTQPMAAGTQCTAGLSSDLAISAVKAGREISAMRFRKRAIGNSPHA